MSKFITFIFVFSMSIFVQASEVHVKPLSYEGWRAQQLMESQNVLTRITNQITILKATTGNLSEIIRLESNQRVAAQNIELVRQLTVEDYFNVYLSKYSEEDESLLLAAQSMSKTEVALLLKSLLRNKSTALSGEPYSRVITDLTGQKSL